MSRCLAFGVLFASVLAGCVGGPQLSSSESVNAAGTDYVMPGRWILAAPNAPTCGMNFAAAGGKNEGSVSPEGGCPERFFTSRRWSLDNGKLSIFDQEKTTLAELAFAGGRFEGKSSAGTPLTLSR